MLRPVTVTVMTTEERKKGLIGKLIAGNEATWVPWCNLDALHLVPGDITKAIAFFLRETGTEPKAITLNPKNERLAKEAGDGIQVSYCAGCLLWETWLSANPTVNFVTPKTATASGEIQAIERNKTQTQPIPFVGRPLTELPMEKVLELKAQGLGAREIAKKVGVSHMTVARALRRAKEDDAQAGGR